MVLAIFGLGPTEILVIVVLVVLLIVGPKKIPQLARAMGQSVGELKKGVRESEEEAAKPTKKKTRKRKKKK